MIPRRVLLENFLSIAGPVDFRFTDDEPLWVLAGPNGVGKSAVFDAITYCLYGEHRGGGQKAEQLIRHGANGFRVVFEFEFAGNEYRITRTRWIKGRSTQKVERRTGPGPDDWEAEPGVNSATDVKGWVKETLGLEFEAFTTSVMLRQGEADKLFSSSRDERIAVLKRIMKFEQFEKLSERVHAKTAELKGKVNDLGRQKEAVKEVTAEELAAAGAALEAAIEARNKASEAVQTAVERVGHSRQWGKLEEKRAELVRQLAKAEARAKQAEAIRTDKARLADLIAFVPRLQLLFRLEPKIKKLEEEIEAQRLTVEKKTEARDAKGKAGETARKKAETHKEAAGECARQAKALQDEIDRGNKFLNLAGDIERLKVKVAEYAVDLSDRLTEAREAADAADQASRAAATALSTATAFLRQVREQQKQFADVKVGVTCSRCGQLVDEAHAAKERNRLAGELTQREEEADKLQEAATEAKQKYGDAKALWDNLKKENEQRDALQAKLDIKQESLTQLGVVIGAAELRRQLTEQEDQKTKAEKQQEEEQEKQQEAAEEFKRLDDERQELDDEINELSKRVRVAENDLQEARWQERAERSGLSPEWLSRLPTLDATSVGELALERERLHKSDVEARFEQLQQDATWRPEWEKELKEVCEELAAIPEDARVPVKEAGRLQEEANAAAAKADTGRTNAQRAFDELELRSKQHTKLTVDLRHAERQLDLHKRLDDLLGQEGLQRELVRSAEEEIICLANDTLQNLSDGELSLEPDEDATGRDDKAFALRLRKAGDPYPIGVSFLSGSQKFRVAVSVALGVGRFASGQARPLEGVIIDEGFGGLDKDGLRAMAEELKRLQRSRLLKRIVLVSHQEEFTDQFPVGYRLLPGPDGPTAEPFRR